MKVYIVQYTHKHDENLSAYSTQSKAEDAVDRIMIDRISESWDILDKIQFEQASTFDHRLEYFHAVEQNVSYGERVQIHTLEVQ